jgi:hypothetical protein
LKRFVYHLETGGEIQPSARRPYKAKFFECVQASPHWRFLAPYDAIVSRHDALYRTGEFHKGSVLLPGVLATSLPAGADGWLMRVTPTAAFASHATLPHSNLVTAAYTPANGYFPISPWGGLALLAAYAAVALLAATWLLRRRDA